MNLVTITKTVILCVATLLGTVTAKAEIQDLPTRTGPKPYVSSHVPHIQVGVEPNPEISKAMLRRVAAMPGIEIRDTVMSMPGALGFRLARGVKLGRPNLGVRQREFAHMHPDGSLHAFLSPELAVQVVKTGWGAHHPYAKKWPKWKGFVMIFTPMSKSELQIVLQLVRASFQFVTATP